MFENKPADAIWYPAADPKTGCPGCGGPWTEGYWYSQDSLSGHAPTVFYIEDFCSPECAVLYWLQFY